MKVQVEKSLGRQLWEMKYTCGQVLGAVEDGLRAWGQRVREIPCVFLGHRWRGWVARNSRGVRGCLMCRRCGRGELMPDATWKQAERIKSIAVDLPIGARLVCVRCGLSRQGELRGLYHSSRERGSDLDIGGMVFVCEACIPHVRFRHLQIDQKGRE